MLHWQPSPATAGSTHANWLHRPLMLPQSHNALKKMISTMHNTQTAFSQKACREVVS